MVEEEDGVEPGLGLEHALQPRELLGAELARDLAGQLRVEPDQLPAGRDDVERQRARRCRRTTPGTTLWRKALSSWLPGTIRSRGTQSPSASRNAS